MCFAVHCLNGPPSFHPLLKDTLPATEEVVECLLALL